MVSETGDEEVGELNFWMGGNCFFFFLKLDGWMGAGRQLDIPLYAKKVNKKNT